MLAEFWISFELTLGPQNCDNLKKPLPPCILKDKAELLKSGVLTILLAQKI